MNENHNMFKNRENAGKQLAEALTMYKNKDAVVIALPRGGVVPAYIIAKKLNIPLDVVLVKKLGHPSNSEYAIGAVSINSYMVNEYISVSENYILEQVKKIQHSLQERYQVYYKNKKPIDLTGKTVIIVDDGVATGNTLIASIKLIKLEQPKEIIVAVPVGPSDTIKKITSYVDKIICLETPYPFSAIGRHYQNFTQVSDKKVNQLLQLTTHA